MSPNSDDLISLWLARHTSAKEKENDKEESILPNEKSRQSSIRFKDNPRISEDKQTPKSQAAAKNREPEEQKNNYDKTSRSAPSLSGRLAEYLARQPSRVLAPAEPLSSTDPAPWSTDSMDTKSVLAMSVVLASHLVRFAGTTMSQQHLLKAREDLMRRFNAKDAVRIEVEAYELLNWFAGAMNESWQEKKQESAVPVQAETSEAAILFIISEAIHNGHDLNMRYYTGSRAEFTERRITPIEVTAEKYLIAYCHMREEERVFRLSRIVRLSPIPDENGELSSKLCYPNEEDTRLPPLPSTPSVELKPAAKSSKKTSKSKSESKSKDKSTPGKARKSEPKSVSGKKKTDSAQSLFDFDSSKKKKTAPKKNPRERSLFD